MVMGARDVGVLLIFGSVFEINIYFNDIRCV